MLKYVVALFIINFCSAGRDNRKVGKYDQVIMSQQPAMVKFFKQNEEFWPSADTNYINYRLGRRKSVSLFNQTKWIMHGLWPFRLAGHTPEFCNKDSRNPVHFDGKLLDRSFKNELSRKWPTFAPNKSLESHWMTEWDKHGCCMLDVKTLEGVKNYFMKSTDLLDNYNVGTILEQAGIKRGNGYPPLRLLYILKRRLNATPYLKCLQYMDPATQFLAEVEICFDKKLNTIDCYYSATFKCDLNKNTIYPIYTL